MKNEIPYVDYQPGQRISYEVLVISPDGSTASHQEQGIIEKVAGGGFYGRFLLLKNRPYGIKTTQPSSSHDLLRQIAWGLRPFPPQASERAAQLDHLATNLISDPLPVVTDGKFYSPASPAYAYFPSGYSQLIETVRGRGPKFFPVNEYPLFRAAQEELTKVAFNMGLEQVGQIHSDNPYAMANLWYDDAKRCFVWLDTLAAFKHEPIFGIMPYKFHKQIRDYFYPNKPGRVTYNKVHTDIFLKYLSRYESKFNSSQYRRIVGNAELYEELSACSFEEQSQRALKPALVALGEEAKGIPVKLRDKIMGIIDLGRAIYDPQVRRKIVFEGIERGRELGFVSPEEFAQAEEDFELCQRAQEEPLRLKAAEVSMAGLYFSASVGTKLLEGTAYALNNFSDNELLFKMLVNLGIFFGGQTFSAGSRFLGTNLIGLVSRTDLRAAAGASAIPVLGVALPFSVQALVDTGSRNNLIWQYTVRNALAKVSSFHPAGGWGTQLEARLYNKFGSAIESLGSKKTEEKAFPEVILDT